MGRGRKNIQIGILGIASALMTFSACLPTSRNQSDLHIDGGRQIPSDGANRVPGVIRIHNMERSSCSAFVVSTNTAITAAHCVRGDLDQNERVNARSCIAHPRPTSALVCAETILRPRLGHGPQGRSPGSADVAVLIYPENTFKHFFSVQSRSPVGGENILIAGYSPNGLTLSEEEIRDGVAKRWGKNIISRLAGTTNGASLIYSLSEGRFDRAGSAPGDSGGPLLTADSCHVSGVISGYFDGWRVFTNVASHSAHTWLKSTLAKGAQICGIEGTDKKYCPEDGLARPYKPSDSKEFPCADPLLKPDVFNPSSSPDADRAEQQIALAFAEKAERFMLNIGVQEKAENLMACFDSEDCRADELGLTRGKTSEGRAIYVARSITKKDSTDKLKLTVQYKEPGTDKIVRQQFEIRKNP